MAETLRIATDNVRSGHGGPFAAIVTRDDEIIARGANLVTSANDPTAHAEITAIRRACASLGSFRLDGCAIYSSCEPCPMCLGAIYWARLDRIYYSATRDDAAAVGFDDAAIYEEVAAALDHRAIPMVNLMREDGQAPLRLWESQPRKVSY